MPGATVPAPRRTRVCVMGFSMIGILPTILPAYADRVDVRTINKLFDEGLQAASDLLRTGEVDVFVAAGASGAYLRAHLPAPVVLVKVTGFDILHALAAARAVSERIAIFSYQAISSELEEVKQLLKLEIEQCFYTTPEDARARVTELAAGGFKAIVGSSMICRLADEAGLAGIFLYSANSVRQAIEDAIEIARLRRMEEARRDWLDSILVHLGEGVVSVDTSERVQSINPAMADLLGVSAEWALSRALVDIDPALSLADCLRTGEPELNKIQRVGHRTLVASRIPVREQGALTGAVLACQDASAIQRADRSLRSHARRTGFTARYRLSGLAGRSPAIAHVRTLAERYARSDATVLVTGESGTGKELVAQGMHNASRRARGPFVAVNCGAFPETLLESELFGYDEGAFTGSRRGGKAGLFEAAHHGTLLLDEIAELPAALQTRLLRVLQEREVLRLGSSEPIPIDVRVIAATNRTLRDEVARGRFREDLFYRLNILHVHLPPLRERPEDLAPLAAALLERAMARHGGSVKAAPLLAGILPLLEVHAWPGNVRELENIIERVAIAVADPDTPGVPDAGLLRSIVPELFEGSPGRTGAAVTLEATSRAHELERIRRTVAQCHGDLRTAAAQLGISRTTLWRRMRAATP